MSARSRSVLVAGFVAYVVATAVHVGWIVAHEPFAFDAWNLAVDTNGEAITLDRFFDYWWSQYTHSNPRLGQPLTYLSYKLDYFAVIATPLAHLAIALAITVLGLGRWPRGRDLALVAIAIGFSWFAFPEIGRNMFNRAYGANYFYSAAVQLWFLVPLRLVGTRAVSTRACVAYAIAGAFAGACNEHTGPALLATIVAYAWWQRRSGETPRLAWAGAIGFAIGVAAIVLAPGQGERYDGLVAKTSLPMRFIQRGVIGALDILHDYLVFAAPLLVLVLVLLGFAIWRGRSRESLVPALRLVALATAIGVAIAATLFVSPKLGSRFYLLGNALLLAATLAVIDAIVERPRRLALLVALGVFASSYAALRTIPLYGRVASQSDERMAMLAAAKPGSVIVADAFDQVDESWWYIGDDFRDPNKRELVARYLSLGQVSFRAFDLKAPLGSTGIRLVARYSIAGETREDTTLDLEGRGLDVAAIVAAVQARAQVLRPETYELAVEFVGAAPRLPRPRIVVARWSHGALVAHPGKLARPGASTAREVTVPASARPLELFAVQLGGEYVALDDDRRFTPWRTGLYWALACDAGACWVVAAGRIHAF